MPSMPMRRYMPICNHNAVVLTKTATGDDFRITDYLLTGTNSRRLIASVTWRHAATDHQQPLIR